MTQRSAGRRGISVLTVVLFFGLVIGVIVFAMHSLWQGSSRTMFSVQEHRELVGLSRSALAETYFGLQVELDTQGAGELFHWFTRKDDPTPRHPEPTKSQQYARDMTGFPGEGEGNMQFSVEPVEVVRVRSVPEGVERYRTQGIVDLRVTVKVHRTRPKHEATLRMIERRNFRVRPKPTSPWLTIEMVDISTTPLATWIDDGVTE